MIEQLRTFKTNLSCSLFNLTFNYTLPTYSLNMGSLEASKQAHLKSISLASLLAGTTEAVNNLVNACKENGFFYLDFRHPLTCNTLKHVDDLTVIGKSFFKLPLEEKEQYSTEKYLPSRLFGYAIFCPARV